MTEKPAERNEPIDAKEGAKMQALPSERHRAFVRAIFQVKPGYGSAVKAAKIAGFGTPTSKPQTMATIASRILHDERVLEAIREYGDRFLLATSPLALRALQKLIQTPAHKDHARGIAMVLDRTSPVELNVKHKHEHDVTPNAMETAQILQRIAELSTKFSVRLPAPLQQIGGPVIEGEAVATDLQAAE